jgi:PhzF family phenazine biosynthesis protein
MQELRYFMVDAFTDRPFAGNPAAVVPLDRWLPDDLMQSIAAELALSETAFFAPEPGAAGVGLRLRWFTPVVEIDLCGHATLASAFVLMTRLEPRRTEVSFASRSGTLGVARSGDVLTLDFPARPPAPEPDPQVRDVVAAALGKPPRELWRARDLVAVYDSADDVRRLAPDFAKIAAIDVHAVIATAPGADGVDFVSRFFAPAQGVPEDPVTGSSHCTLTPLWAERLGRRTLLAHQVSKRGGVLECTLAGDRVKLGGRAVLVATGALIV